MKTAVITGSSGQDGTYISQHLNELGYRIIGIDRSAKSIDLRDTQRIFDLIKEIKPDEIYHLAAFHQSSQEKVLDDLEVLNKSYDIHVLAAANLLEGIRRFCPSTRFFYAASSHMYGRTTIPIQDDTTPFRPDNFYGITKVAGTHLCRYYRHNYNIFASVGILYNHESPIRKADFISQKIIKAAVAISMRQQDKLILGDLEAEIDWGYAGDYVVAMQQILQLPYPGEFIISSGERHKVKDFVEEAFKQVGLDWKQYVQTDSSLLNYQKKVTFLDNQLLLTKVTDWKPRVSFSALIKLMIQKELEKHS